MFLTACLSWLPRMEWLEQVLGLPWQRIPELYIGEKLALAGLAAATCIGGVTALDRLFAGDFSWPKARRTGRPPKRKKGLGVKWVVMALIALLPGGLVGMAGIYTIMGKEKWRSDALRIAGLSLAPAGLLGVLRLEWFPWPELRDSVYVSGLFGLVFGLLQTWAMIKLLRQWWGEPDECVPWWPPMALCLQAALLAAVVFRLLAPG